MCLNPGPSSIQRAPFEEHGSHVVAMLQKQNPVVTHESRRANQFKSVIDR